MEMETVAEGCSQAAKIGHAAPNCIDNKGDYTRRQLEEALADAVRPPSTTKTTKLLKLQ